MLYTPSSKKSLELIQLYGKHRFSDGFVTSTRDNIRSFLLIDHHQTDLSNLCTNDSTTRCKDQLCLPINSTEVKCLSIDETVKPITNMISLLSQGATQSSEQNDPVSNVVNPRKQNPYRQTNTILLCIIFIGVLITVSEIFR